MRCASTTSPTRRSPAVTAPSRSRPTSARRWRRTNQTRLSAYGSAWFQTRRCFCLHRPCRVGKGAGTEFPNGREIRAPCPRGLASPASRQDGVGTAHERSLVRNGSASAFAHPTAPSKSSPRHSHLRHHHLVLQDNAVAALALGRVEGFVGATDELFRRHARLE